MSKFSQQALNIVRPVFSIDLRALGMFRMLMAMSVLLDIAVRLPDLEVFYTDAGVFPVKAFHDYWSLPWYWSIHALSGTLAWQVVLCALSAAAAVAMLVGWRTRMATVVTWALMISVQNRNPMVLMGVDELMLVLLFFAIFLPLNKRYSIDARRHPEWFLHATEFSFPTAALILQVVFIYIFTYLQKTGAEWTTEGTAIWYALQVDELVKPLGKWLLNFPQFLHIMTFLVLRAELVIPLLFLLPVYTREARIVGFVLLCSMHIGFALTLLVSYFPLVNIIAAVIFLPRGFWDWLDRKGLYRLHLPKSDFNVFTIKNPVASHTCAIIRQAVPALMIIYVLWWNICTLNNNSMPKQWQYPGIATRLGQRWDMFAPYPMKDDGWFAMPGRLVNGKVIEVWRIGQDLKFHKPTLVLDDYPSFRWEKYMHRLWEKQNGWLRPYFASWRCRSWNATHSPDQHLEYFRMFYVEEFTLPPGNPPRRSISNLGKYFCTEAQ
jgi:hypothetical protein